MKSDISNVKIAVSFQTEKPYWLNEAYTEATSALDVSVMRRNLELCRQSALFISALFNPNGRFLDYGGGYGIFVRLMRDRGFDFRWQDRFARNLFARGFEGDVSGKYDVITAFQILE